MTVVWRPEALDQLAEGYVALPLLEQRALADTVERVVRELAARPLDLGESRDPVGPGVQLRFWCQPPLSVWFFVSAQGVEVASVVVRPGR